MALVLLVLLSAWTTWLGATETGALARQLPAILLWMLGGLLVWTLGWSFMGKLFTGVTGFWRHVCIASVGMVIMALLDVLLSVLGFALSWPLLTRFASLVSLSLLAVVVWFHLRAATLVSARNLALAMASLLVLGAGAKLGLQWQTQKRLGDNLYMSTMLPPEWRWAPPPRWTSSSRALTACATSCTTAASSKRTTTRKATTAVSIEQGCGPVSRSL